MNKRIYVDLDETLIHTSVGYETEVVGIHKDAVSFKLDGLAGRRNIYRVLLRAGAKELLSALREGGAENVFMLTVATIDYATKINEILGLGFEPSQIFAREHLHGNKGYTLPRVPVTQDRKSYLIDNLPRYELGGKLAFIHRHGAAIDQTYTWKVEDFMGRPDDQPEFGGLTSEDISNILLYIRGETV